MQLQSLAPVIDSNSKLLILGSMPGQVSLQKQQYYANPRNHFWPLLFRIFEVEPIDAYSQRLEFVLSKGIALWDVLQLCDRKGSLDSSIRNEEVNDFKSFFQRYPNLKHVLFNGTKAKQAFTKKLKNQLFPGISFYLLPSSSPTPGKNVKRLHEKTEDWMTIKKLVDQ